MPGLVPGIHVCAASSKGADGRDKSGHDGVCIEDVSLSPEPQPAHP